MTNNEVNKVIAEYMGKTLAYSSAFQGWVIHNKDNSNEKMVYTESLDVLVPVWHKAKLCLQYISKEGERLEDLDNYYIPINGKYRAWVTEIGYYENYWSDKDTIQEAAAHATAKAILALGEK